MKGYIGSVRFFKNLILLLVIVFITVPTVFSLRYKAEAKHFKQQLDTQAQQQTQQVQTLQQQIYALEAELDTFHIDPEGPAYQQLYPDFYAPQVLDATNKADNVIYLTFDDGPSYPTPEFLDLIDKLDIRVTFFTIGVQMGDAGQALRDQLMRREALGGHSLANHTYTHGIYGNLYDSLDIFMDAVKRQDELVYSVTGGKPDVFRFPAGSYYCPFRTAAIEELDKIGYGWIDWIANAYDSGPLKPSDSILNNILWQVHQDQVTVVLMHDWRYDTLGALERIVTALKADNYLFLPLFKESSTINTAKPRWG